MIEKSIPKPSEHLQKIFEEIEPIFDKYKTNISTISDDVRCAELFLAENNINHEFSLMCFHELIEEQDIEHYLCWKNDGHKFRIIYYSKNYRYKINNEEKPLIETPSVIRRKLYRHLPVFLKAFAEFLNKK